MDLTKIPFLRTAASMSWLAELPSKPRTTLRRIASLLAGFAERSPVSSLSLAIAIPLSGEALRQALQVQTSIYRRFGYNPALEGSPHITLKLGFQMADSAPVEDYLMKLAAETRPIPITMNQCSWFEDDGYYIIDVEKNLALDELRQRIICELRDRFQIEPHPVEGEGFRFHVTLAYGLSRHELDSLREAKTPCELNLTFMASNIDLLCYLGGRWIPQRSAELRAHGVSPAN